MASNSESSNVNPGTTLFIGGGNMARSLIGGLVASGCSADLVHVVEPRAEAREELADSFGVHTHADAGDAVGLADNVVFAVKPQVIGKVCAGLDPAQFRDGVVIMSVAAGVRLDQLGGWLGPDLAMVRVMPNTPALIGAGAIGLCANDKVDDAQRQRTEEVFTGSGLVRWIEDEKLMDTVTGLSGSGPAYFFAFVEALEAAATAQGLPADVARDLACQTCLGAGRMLTESGDSPAELRKKVTSPGGTTAAGLDSLASDGLPAIAARAIAAATRRGGELSAELD
ncbi:MAG: pyrroline-5-carboxylate reductase [Rhodanobacteraceae bacterium]